MTTSSPATAAWTSPPARVGSRDEAPGVSPATIRFGLAAGFVLGVVQGLGNVLVQRGPWWEGLAGATLTATSHAAFVLAGIAIAARFPLRARNGWWPFVLAGLVVSALASAFEIAVVRVLLFHQPKPTLIGAAWFWLPSYLIIGALAGLAYWHWLDARRRAGRIRDLNLERTRIAHETYARRLQALQARVEPGFLFDTLADVERLHGSDPGTAMRLLDELIAYLRAVLPTRDAAWSTLAAECTLVRRWLEVVALRSGVEASLTVVPGAVPDGARLPPMVLLPLVQYAWEAGTGRGAGALRIAVATEATPDRVAVRIDASEDALSGADASSEAEQVRARLSALVDPGGTLRFEKDASGTTAVVEVPRE